MRSKGRWREDKALPVTGRDLIWLAGGVEKGGVIHWSQPELISYTLDGRGANYPDLVEVDGKYFLTATNKKDARVFEIDKTLIEGMWNQAKLRETATRGVIFERKGEQNPGEAKMPQLPELAAGGGFSIDFWVKFESLKPNQILLDSLNADGVGIRLITTETNELRLEISDGGNQIGLNSDAGVLTPGQWQHISFIVDGGPKMIAAAVDGLLCDGGKDPKRYSGQARFLDQSFNKPIGNVTGSDTVKIAPALDGKIRDLRIYGRYLRTSEAIGNYRAGTPP